MKRNNQQLSDELRQKQLEIRKEDRKSLPRLLIVIVDAAIIGFAIGLGMGFMDEYSSESLAEMLEQFWMVSALWMIPVFTVLLLVPSLILCR